MIFPFVFWPRLSSSYGPRLNAEVLETRADSELGAAHGVGMERKVRKMGRFGEREQELTGHSYLTESELACASTLGHVSFHDPAAKLASFCFQDFEVRVQEKPKPLNRDTERASKRGNKHTKIKPTVYLKPASHLCKIATAA